MRTIAPCVIKCFFCDSPVTPWCQAQHVGRMGRAVHDRPHLAHATDLIHSFCGLNGCVREGCYYSAADYWRKEALLRQLP